jgi:RING finger/CHY zinc finger protein 1
MRHNCPVCFEYLFDSVRPTAVLPCGHTIHSDCLKEMERHRQLACPTCLRSYADLAPVWRRVDEEVAATPMPPEYAAWVVSTLCNDCGGRGSARFHVLGHKCGACGSYNTRRLGIDRGEAAGLGGGAGAAAGGGEEGVAVGGGEGGGGE